MKKILFTVFSLVLTLTACQVVETDMIDTTERKSVYKNELIFSASDFKSDETLDTRTDIAPGGGFLWSANDTVGIFPNSGSQVYFAMTSGAGASSATFDGGGWDFKPSAVYRSYYPLIGEFYLDPTKIPVCYLGQKQVGNNNSSRIGPYDFMFTPATSASDGNLHFSYAHLGTIIQPKITLPAGRYVTMTLIAPDPVFVETGHFDLTSSSPAIVGDSYSRTLSINLDVTLSSESQLITYILSAPFDLSGKTLTVIVQDDEGNSYTGLKPIPNNKPFVAEMKYGLNIASTTLGPAPNEIWYMTMPTGSTSSVVPFTPSEYKISAATGNRLDLANCVVPGADNGYRGILRFKGPITEIDQYAFSNTDVWKVTLPDCVQTIHRGAFQQCAMLSVANLGTGIKSIGEYAFSGTDLSSINLPEGLDIIGAFAFEETLLESVAIPESVSHLGFSEEDPEALVPLGNPFLNCPNLRRFEGKFASQDGRALIEFVEGNGNSFFVSFATKGMDGQAYRVPEVYGVSPYAFAYSTIGSVTFSDNLHTIYLGAFRSCEQLKSVKMPSTLGRIGGFAFYDCGNLEFIEINSPQVLINYDGHGHIFDGSSCPIYVPSSLVDTYKTTAPWSSYASRYHFKQPDYAIWYTTTDNQMANITLPTGYTNQYSDGMGVLKSPNNITEIPEQLFQNCTTLKTVSIPDQVTRINGLAFDGCSNLESVNFGNSVNYLDSWSFRNCKLGTLVLPETLTTISDNAFEGNPFTTVRIPANTVIYTNVFANCANLESFTGDNSMIADGGRCLISSDGTLLSFAPASTAGLYEIPEGVTAIGFESFRKAKFSELRIPASVTEIGAYSIMDCPNLTKITIESLTLPELIDVISVNRLFNNLPSDYEIWLPGAAAVTVGSSSAAGWDFFDDHFVVYQTDSELWFHEVGNAFDDLYLVGDYTGDGVYDGVSQAALYLNAIKEIKPQNVLPASISDDLTYIKVLSLTSGENITKMADYGFSDEHPATSGLNQAQKIDWVSLPNTITTIGQKTFKGCSNLLLNPLGDWRADNLTTIGDEAFNGCTSMVWQVDPYSEGFYDWCSKLSSIGRKAFKNCSSLNWALGFNCGPSIGQDAFEGSSLPAVYFYTVSPSIEKGAFKNCTQLKSAFLGTITDVKDSTFYKCSTLERVTFAQPHMVTSFGAYAFANCNRLTSLGTVDENGVSEVTSLETMRNTSLRSTGLTKLRLPSIARLTESNMFQNIPLVSLELPNLTYACGNSFMFLSPDVEELYLPRITSVGAGDLFSPGRPSKLTLGPNIANITSRLWGYFTSSTFHPYEVELYLERTTPPTVTENLLDSKGNGEQMLSIRGIYVPAGSVEAYRTNSSWIAALNKIGASVDVIQAMPTD